MACPLCAHGEARPSWLGSTFYRGREFAYIECASCATLYCDPMPDAETLAQMYGPEYETAVAADAAAGDDSKEPQRVVARLKGEPGGGTFVVNGCGTGSWGGRYFYAG